MRDDHIIPAMIMAACLMFAAWPGSSRGEIHGPCVNCHTMHNSQGGAPMAWDESGDPDPDPNENLLRSSCFGCHAMGSNSAMYDLGGGDMIPQVLHTENKDLAGGNFAYITGAKGSGGDDKGHNISNLAGMGADSVLEFAPGALPLMHHMGKLTTERLSCAGIVDQTIGCHGYRNAAASSPQGITGSHHNNIDGKLEDATNPGNSYRFLMGVKGYEDSDWEYTYGANDHNEYYGRDVPITLGCGSGALQCHGGSDGVVPPEGTMSQFCATCHGNFHTIDNGSHFPGDGDGIGPDAVSPFIRHPTDLALPLSGEYASYLAYNNQAPVARTSGLPDNPVGSVAPGSDAVMCLSCHRAHAGEYPDMLRWNYSTIIAGEGAGNTDGCFVCHTTKN